MIVRIPVLTDYSRYVPPAEEGGNARSGPSGSRNKGQNGANKGAKKSQSSGPKVLG
jgi:hypothetical protein